jgi:uncharacterized protein involved in response to NO
VAVEGSWSMAFLAYFFNYSSSPLAVAFSASFFPFIIKAFALNIWRRRGTFVSFKCAVTFLPLKGLPILAPKFVEGFPLFYLFC